MNDFRLICYCALLILLLSKLYEYIILVKNKNLIKI